jgi:hypothetical protein
MPRPSQSLWACHPTVVHDESQTGGMTTPWYDGLLVRRSPSWPQRRTGSPSYVTSEEKVSGLFFGSFAWADGRLEVQLPRDCLPPISISQGIAPVDAGANGLEFRGLLTRSVQRGERAMGQAESKRGFRSGSSRHRFSEPHVQSSARLTSPARKALRSTYRQTSRKCSSSWTGKLFNRP